MLPAIAAQALFLIFPVGMAYATVSDLATMRIPNALSVVLLAAFCLMAPLAGIDWQAIGLHAAAGAIVLVLSFACFACGWIGGGDAKLAAVIALWLGFDHLVELLVVVGIWGGVLTLAFLSFRRFALPAFALGQEWIERLHDPRSGIPYGVALAAGGLAIYPDTVWSVFAGL